MMNPHQKGNHPCISQGFRTSGLPLHLWQSRSFKRMIVQNPPLSLAAGVRGSSVFFGLGLVQASNGRNQRQHSKPGDPSWACLAPSKIPFKPPPFLGVPQIPCRRSNTHSLNLETPRNSPKTNSQASTSRCIFLGLPFEHPSHRPRCTGVRPSGREGLGRPP